MAKKQKNEVEEPKTVVDALNAIKTILWWIALWIAVNAIS